MTSATRSRSQLIPALFVVALVLLAWPSTSAATGYGTLADCISRSGAVMYSADWCPMCRAQRKEFHGYFNRIKTVECSSQKGQMISSCKSLSIDSFPTWIFADGSRAEGMLSADDLAGRTGCAVPD